MPNYNDQIQSQHKNMFTNIDDQFHKIKRDNSDDKNHHFIFHQKNTG